MESDLHNVIKKGDVLKDIHKRFVMYQLLNAIKYMHSGNVIHRDLKPSNILIDSKCRLKVADFGLARTLSTKRKSDFDDLANDAMLTDYVATRWYRAPEILVASRKYTKGIDMWSLGCILGEMIRQKPLFQGTSTINQIEKIVTALPDVTQQDIDSIGASFGTVLLSKKISRDRRHSLEEMLRNCCDDAMSLVKSLLVLDPHGRLTAKAAIMHPYVSRFRTASADMQLHIDIHPPLQDDVRYGVDEYRNSLYEMIGAESRTSARKLNTQAPVTSNRETTSTKHQRAVSRVRTLSARQSIQVARHQQQQQANPKRTFIQKWAQQQQQELQQQQLQEQQKESPASSYQQRQKQQRSKKPSQAGAQGDAATPGGKSTQSTLLTAERSLTMARNTHAALRKELAAVAATAPKKKNAYWQSQAEAQVLLHAEAEARVKALLAKTKLPLYRSPLEKVNWGDKNNPNPDNNAEAEAETNKDVSPRLRSRSLRKSKAKAKGGEEKAGDKDRKQKDQQQQLKREKEHLMAENSRLMEQERIRLEEMDRMGNKEMSEQRFSRRLKHCEQLLDSDRKSDDSEKFYTPATTGRMVLEPEPEPEPAPQPQPDPQRAKQRTSQSKAQPVCYRSRIHYLEAEMAKCKRQLVNIVQDNQEVLSHRKLRYHFQKLQPDDEEDDDEFDDMEEPPAGGGGDGAGDGGTNNYELFLKEQSKQKQLQLQEFLARDDTNDFELPNLRHVYRAKSYHSFGPQSGEGSSSSSGGNGGDKARAGAAAPAAAARTKTKSKATGSESSNLASSHSNRSGHNPQCPHHGKPFRKGRRQKLITPESLDDSMRLQQELEAQFRACRRQRERLGMHHQVIQCQRHSNSHSQRQQHQHRRKTSGGPDFQHMRQRPQDIEEAQFVHRDQLRS
ncbi:hypothetical protein KR009_004075 [Drosophila setifemur]|nr:hypothetical protein KR009_004075 [Drosophila setifemur]